MVLDACFSSSGVVLSVVTGLSELTGSLFTAILLIVILVLLVCVGLFLPIEISAILMLPFFLVCYACVPNFTAITGVVLIYLGILIAKNFLIK